jgi:diadenosine tetraphosphate (Ap4A) HIT family hydrolase
MAFELHAQIAADSVPLLDLKLCAVRLMDVAALPWLLLIPRRADLREIIDLTEADQSTLWKEIAVASSVLKTAVNPTKLNVAALGNVVPQLHVHVIARFDGDAAWPKPVWGNLPMAPYAAADRDAMAEKLCAALRTAVSH